MSDLSIMVGQERDGSVSVLRLEGDIDASTHKSLEEKASEVIVGGAENILLDLSGVKYMGSAGFRSIHAISNRLESGGAQGLGMALGAVALGFLAARVTKRKLAGWGIIFIGGMIALMGLAPPTSGRTPGRP